MTRYIVMTSVASAPRGTNSLYRNVAVVEVEPGHPPPKMIRADARGLRRIVKHWGPQYVGKTQHCAYHRAVMEAEAMADGLNSMGVSA